MSRRRLLVGTAAALLAHENGAKVMLVTKLRHGDANTMMAEGGIQAADKLWKDSPAYHYIDTLGGGHFTNDPDLVNTLVTDAPDVLHWLEDLGMMFGKKPDGTMETLPAAGFCRSLCAFCAMRRGTARKTSRWWSSRLPWTLFSMSMASARVP